MLRCASHFALELQPEVRHDLLGQELEAKSCPVSLVGMAACRPCSGLSGETPLCLQIFVRAQRKPLVALRTLPVENSIKESWDRDNELGFIDVLGFFDL